MLYKEMYSPCFECMNKHGKQYTKDCDDKCEFANVMSKINSYGGIDTIIKCMEGKAVPIALLSQENIDETYKMCMQQRTDYLKNRNNIIMKRIDNANKIIDILFCMIAVIIFPTWLLKLFGYDKLIH